MPKEPGPERDAWWRRRWTERLPALAKADREEWLAGIERLCAGESTPRWADPGAIIERELACETMEHNPIPYVLNVGCGFAPTSIGQRTADGRPVAIVGVDPMAFQISDAMKLMIQKSREVAAGRRFVLPLVGEELAAAIPPGAFDAVWSDGAILDCVDPPRFLSQCARAARPGGIVAIKVGTASPERLWRVDAIDGSRVAFSSDMGRFEIGEVRGERLEVHTLLDGSLLLKIRRPFRTLAQAETKAKKLIV